MGPHVNESGFVFEVNKEGEIRFGLGAIKGTGDAAVEAIIAEREEHGHFIDIFDFAERVNQRSVNKKTYECLAMSGAFDCFEEYHRRQYLEAPEGDVSLIEKAIKYASLLQAEKLSTQVSLFGGENNVSTPKPSVSPIEPFGEIQKLNIEREVVGLYISGHPLDNFQFEMENFCNMELKEFAEIENYLGKEFKCAGIVTTFSHRITKGGKPFGSMTLEDYNGSHNFVFFGEEYLKFKEFMMQGWFLFIEGSVVKQKWGEQRIEPKINHIELLHDLREKRTKGIHLKIQLSSVDRQFLQELESLCKSFKGDKSLKVSVIHQHKSNMIATELISRKYSINPSNDFFKAVKKNSDVICDVLY